MKKRKEQNLSATPPAFGPIAHLVGHSFQYNISNNESKGVHKELASFIDELINDGYTFHEIATATGLRVRLLQHHLRTKK